MNSCKDYIRTYKNFLIRNATVDDALLLEKWWNDGKIMAHAGFPNGTGQTAKDIAKSIEKDMDKVRRRMIIELDGVPIGETNYSNVGEGIAEIGIKICDFSKHDKGYGKIILSMLISYLFHELGYLKIILDTNVNNKRAQHVYEQLGFSKIRVRENSWTNQLGELQSCIDYELTKEHFVNFAG